MPSPILTTRPLGAPPWATADPFLFCVHHDDAYPRGNANLGPAASLEGRDLGQDFAGQDGWRMYHGQEVPGFPSHPHRGFETVTIVRRGLIDHADSLGASARYGRGDVQWLTAGAGISHSEMFPLVDAEQPNPLELFQIWLNLPAADKLAEPHFTMFWNEDIPRRSFKDEAGRATEVTLIAGALEGAKPLAPPPHSWAARREADVAIWTVRLDAGARWTLPPAAGASTERTLYAFRRTGARFAGEAVAGRTAVAVRGDLPVAIEAADGETELLLLQGRPIGEPVVAYGPFVMSSRAEIERAFADYRRTRFGGWPWPKDDPVFARDEGRFARHADGRLERATG
jgi:redox-sensitive bicupin YhaK (pirin superfamily)